jgi:hypothetical protein
VNYTNKFDVKKKTTRIDPKLVSMVVIATVAIITIGSTTAVQARTGDGFDDGYAKAKLDFANNYAFNDSCSPKSAYCQHYVTGYITAWVQAHWSTGTPYNMQLLTVNKTA